MRHRALVPLALAGALAVARAAAQPAAPHAPGAAAPASAAAPPPAITTAPSAAAASSQPAAAAPQEEDTFSDRFVLDTGRFEFAPTPPDRMTFAIHGEEQLRFRGLTTLRLEPPASDPTATDLGQNRYLYNWLRITPRFDYRGKAALVAQVDVLRGLVVGDTTRYVTVARDPLDTQNPFTLKPRYLYGELRTPIGLFRVGQQSAYWGLGIVANDGDHPSLFGDYQRGALGEKILYATKPLGENKPLLVAVSGELVFQDYVADLVDDKDRAFQGVAAVAWQEKAAEIGAYGVFRHQERDAQSTGPLTPFNDVLDVGVLDAAGKFHVPVPGANAFTYGAFEAAAELGSTTFTRAVCELPLTVGPSNGRDSIRAFGGAATLGGVHVTGSGDQRYGDVVAEIEWGFASGDANPCDGVSKRFTFDPNHNVGLVLFDHVLAWKTARAGTLAQDRLLVARAAPGAQLLASNGGIFGAEYLNPRVVVRPRSWLDFKAGVVIAQTTGDFVDPYHFGALGNVANYDGGDAHRHDLGIELDAGLDTRIRVKRSVTFQIGAEGGVLFPGHAFDDAAGNRLDTQAVVAVKAGVQY